MHRIPRSGCSYSSTALSTALDNAGRSWIDIGGGLPSDFGFPLALHPADPDTGLRISEMLGLVRDDVDVAAGVIHVRAQLSRASRRASPTRRAEDAVSAREIPLVAQLARPLRAPRQTSRFARSEDWLFATARGSSGEHGREHPDAARDRRGTR